MSPAPPRLRLRLSPAAEKAVRQGHPWVYSDSVREQNRAGRAGELAVIYSRADTFLAAGLYDPESPMRVRILHAGEPVPLNGEWWKGRLHSALAKREGMFGPDTTGYRLINGESDGWPGLVLDRYADTLVLKLYSAVWLPRLEEVLTLVEDALAPGGTVLRLSRNITETARRDFGVSEGWVRGAGPETVVFLENGLRFESEVQRGQKTGFFLDQRENRRRAGELADGADVLNAFSFSGGFSLCAARGGAREVTDLEISRHALEAGARNFALNAGIPAVAACRRSTVQADAFEWLAQSHGSFDLVIVDPPSLAKREAERAGAIAAYERLAASALRCVRRGGVLMAASCSAHVSAEEFFAAVNRSARAWRTLTLWTSGHAPDHPATFREAEYLKCIALRVEQGRN
jgi:23S rRNA (cytosine1962-C5)-methyltransferase